MAQATPFRWQSASCSHVGRVRRINEDAMLDQPERGLWAVADGMGGHTLGDVASRMVVDALAHLPQTSTDAIRACLAEVNRRLMTEAAMRDVQVIGSTAVVLLASGSHCSCLWAGDSRIYRYRDGVLQQLTRDHSHVEELVARGLLSPTEAKRRDVERLLIDDVAQQPFAPAEPGRRGAHRISNAPHCTIKVTDRVCRRH